MRIAGLEVGVKPELQVLRVIGSVGAGLIAGAFPGTRMASGNVLSGIGTEAAASCFGGSAYEGTATMVLGSSGGAFCRRTQPGKREHFRPGREATELIGRTTVMESRNTVSGSVARLALLRPGKRLQAKPRHFTTSASGSNAAG